MNVPAHRGEITRFPRHRFALLKKLQRFSLKIAMP
jgi:hypothetical protein